jgi:UbiD family decarboxylase
MKYQDLRDFIGQLEARGEFPRVSVEVDPHLEIAEKRIRVSAFGRGCVKTR